ncbi:hypothetical protein CVT26_007240 [Gymnopilus dilepis]|uniref:Uncharacterized protein n=1 Tax=Gymnopilus dilepis TaxID=231916 RepID=A0A409VMJ9_9AGAR|nr:hypothetical protein CVT26_007240 [Gymnopilus dilepis]
MDDRRHRCPVFCTANIPVTTLNYLLECSEEYLSEFDKLRTPMPIYHYMVIMDSKNLSTITEGSSPPVTSCPTAFLGHTLQEIHDWFQTNISQPYASGYSSSCFLVLDEESEEDDTCIFVCTQDEAPGEIHSLRCGFELALQNAVVCGIGGDSMEEGVLGSYMRSGVTMTKEHYKLALNGGCYIEDGEVKVDQACRDFLDW